MFLDIRNFSSYAAGQRPEAVMTYLNTLFDFMIDVVNEHHGIVNKFSATDLCRSSGLPSKTPSAAPMRWTPPWKLSSASTG